MLTNLGVDRILFHLSLPDNHHELSRDVFYCVAHVTFNHLKLLESQTGNRSSFEYDRSKKSLRYRRAVLHARPHVSFFFLLCFALSTRRIGLYTTFASLMFSSFMHGLLAKLMFIFCLVLTQYYVLSNFGNERQKIVGNCTGK